MVLKSCESKEIKNLHVVVVQQSDLVLATHLLTLNVHSLLVTLQYAAPQPLNSLWHTSQDGERKGDCKHTGIK